MASAVPKLDTFDPLTPRAELDLVNCGNCMDALNACYQAQGCWNSFVGGSANQANCISWCQQAICMPCPVSRPLHEGFVKS
jgi:hypothetical protein